MVVQVRLKGEEGRVIELLPCGIISPRAVACHGTPIIRGIGAMFSFSVSPDIPVGFWVIARACRLFKPGVLIRSVIQHQVKYQLHISSMYFFHQLFKNLHITV